MLARGSCGARAPPPPRAKPKSQYEFVPRDSQESEFLDLLNFEDVAFSVETVIQKTFCYTLFLAHTPWHTYLHTHTHTHTHTQPNMRRWATQRTAHNAHVRILMHAPLTHTHTNWHIHTFAHTHTFRRRCVGEQHGAPRTHTHTHARPYHSLTDTLRHTHTCTHTHVHTHSRRCVGEQHDAPRSHTHTHTRHAHLHTHTDTYTHLRARTHTHTHTQPKMRGQATRRTWSRSEGEKKKISNVSSLLNSRNKITIENIYPLFGITVWLTFENIYPVCRRI